MADDLGRELQENYGQTEIESCILASVKVGEFTEFVCDILSSKMNLLKTHSKFVIIVNGKQLGVTSVKYTDESFQLETAPLAEIDGMGY